MLGSCANSSSVGMATSEGAGTESASSPASASPCQEVEPHLVSRDELRGPWWRLVDQAGAHPVSTTRQGAGDVRQVDPVRDGRGRVGRGRS